MDCGEKKHDSFIRKLSFKAENECNEADKINATYDVQEHCSREFVRFFKREITKETS